VHVLDGEGRITFVNPSAAAMLGFSAEELLGREQHPLIHHSRRDGLPYPPADCPIVASIRDGSVRRQDGDVFWRKDGTSLPVDYIVTPIQKDGLIVGTVVAFRDVTERQHAAQLLAGEQARRAEGDRLSRELQRVFMEVPAAVCTTRGPDHIIETANTRYQQLVGRSDLIGKKKREVFPETSPEFTEALDQVYATGDTYLGTEVQGTWDRGSGAPEEGFVNFAYQSLRNADGAVYGIMCHIVDVTDLVRSRRLVEEHAEELKRATQSLSRINRELDQFAYVASHDLRAPLRGITSLATWIEDDLGAKLGNESRQHLALLRSRVHRMDALIDGILEYSRVGRVRSRIEEVNVGELLTEVVEMLNVPAQASIDVRPGMPTLQTERLPLQQVFLNLIENALKHAARPDLSVRIDASDAGEFYEFTVADDGVGIPAQYHAKIWEIFQTLQPRDKVEGAGIGLALVKKNVEGRGGRAWLESEGLRGATFHFLWPKQLEEEGS
jgi:PAS domain S-box-containing protein